MWEEQKGNGDKSGPKVTLIFSTWKALPRKARRENISHVILSQENL